jgi:hypothetical protein
MQHIAVVHIFSFFTLPIKFHFTAKVENVYELV